jgi:PII-like signaling protein
VSREAAKLTAYFGESDRVGRRALCDVLLDLFGERSLRASALLRGTEGFGLKQLRHSQNLLSLSEDLPLVAVAVDARDRIEAIEPEVAALVVEGLVTVEGADFVEPALVPGAQAKLTVYLGRREPYAAAVEILRRAGVDGATVLMGVDGLLHGERKRARFFSRNDDVPLELFSVGAADSIARALPDLRTLLPGLLCTFEGIRVCKRNGTRLDRPAGGGWQKLTVVAAENAQHEGRPLYLELVRRLRLAGAAGATAVRGIWGYSADHAPYGDRALALRRRAPVVTTIVDRAPQIDEWFGIVDELTDEAGLVTSEPVPHVDPRPPDYDSPR